MMFKALFASVCLLSLGLVGQSALAEPRYYTCGDNGPVTAQDQCPDGSTPFLHLGIPPRAGADPEPDPRPDDRPETTRQVIDQCDSTSDPYTCKWKRYKASKCKKNPQYFYCSAPDNPKEEAPNPRYTPFPGAQLYCSGKREYGSGACIWR